MSKIYQVYGLVTTQENGIAFDDVSTWHAEFADKSDADKCAEFMTDLYRNKYNVPCDFMIIEIDTNRLDNLDSCKEQALEAYKLTNE